ncbi:MAG: His/Gly/Thr/Pro-type tRNA ligase C-terminal domain-containing protein, partial [Christensenellaceae bacterium]
GTREAAAKLLKELRQNGKKADMDHTGRSLKAQFKYAGKMNAKKVVVIGEEELQNGTVTVKDMEEGVEKAVKREEIIMFI